MRMKKKDRASDNCIQWRLSRGWREAMGMLSWHLTSNKGNTGDALANSRVVKRLGPWREAHNTTRGLTPGRKDPRVSRDAPGNWISWPSGKGGKDWGKAQITLFTDKIRKKPGPRKAKAAESSDVGTQNTDEQLEEDSPEDEQTEDETSESEDDKSEQPTASISAYRLPPAPGMATGQGLQHPLITHQDSRRGPGPIVTDPRQQHGLGPRPTRRQASQTTQDENAGVLQQGYNNRHLPRSRPSTLLTNPRSNPIRQHFPNSRQQPYQAATSNLDVPENVPDRGLKRQIHESNMEGNSPFQSEAKRPRVQQPQANGAHPSFEEIVADMPRPMAMYHKHKAKNPHRYTKEAMAARKPQAQGSDASGTTRPLPPVVRAKRHFESLDTEDLAVPHSQAKKSRQSESQGNRPASLSAEAKPTILQSWNESHANRLVISTTSSQPAPKEPQVNQRQCTAPSLNLGSNHTAQPVQRNSQGQNFVNSAGQEPPVRSEGTGSSSAQLVPRLSTPGYYGIPIPGPGNDLGAPLNAYQQAYIDSQNQIDSAHGYINPALLSHSMPSSVTQSTGNSVPTAESITTGASTATSTDTPDENFNFDVLDPDFYIVDSSFLDFPADSTMQSQPGDVDEGPMTDLLNGDDLEFDFKMPEMDSNGDI